jgi:hypothetical protein
MVLNPALNPALAPATAEAPAPAVQAAPRPRKPLPKPGPGSAPKVPQALVESALSAINSEAIEVPAEAAPSLPEPAASAAMAAVAPAPDAVLSTSPIQPPAPTGPLNPSPLRSPNASAASAIATPYTVPGSVRLKYRVEGKKDHLIYRADAQMLWRHDGNIYEAQLEVSAFLIGARVRTSSGRLTAEGLQPTRFADKYRSELAAHFDRVNQKVTFSANTPEVPLQVGMQDQLSVFVQLGALLGGAPDAYPAGTELVFETIGPRAPETWLITVEGDETLSLPGGQIATVKLSRSTQREFEQKAELWLAPSLGYLPVRIRLTERNGDYVDQVWRATEAP